MKGSVADNTLPKDKLHGIYRGVIENNEDPLNAGRCRIRVVGIHTSDKTAVPTENLVWAQPATPIFGGVSQVGIYGVPCQGAHVFLFFEAGNILQPRYFASAPGIPTTPPTTSEGFNDPDGNYPSAFGDPDWNITEDEVHQQDIFVIADKAGNKLVFDSTEGNEQIYIEHGTTHSKLVFKPSGSISKESGTNTDETYTGAQKNVVGGDHTQMVIGKDVRTAGSAFHTVAGDNKHYVAGSSDTTVMGIDNRQSGGMSWNINGDATFMTGGEVGFVSDANTVLKSNTMSVKLKALLMNIEMTALLGSVKSTSLTYSSTATTTASLMGLIQTSIGGGVITKMDGVITKVDSFALTMISSSGIILIG